MRIEFVFDLVCPWCYVGKRRLEHALRVRPDRAVDLSWHPFQLNPDMPRAGIDRATYLATKFGDMQRAGQIDAMIADVAAREGLHIRFDAIRRIPNTIDAHRLMRLAQRRGLDGTVMAESLFRAHFVEGRDLGDRGELVAIGTAAGLNPESVASYLGSTSGAAEVRATDLAARRSGIQAVPCFIFDGRYALSGAQEPGTFLPLFDLTRASTTMTATV
jgi:predicted DsbA family dithiol-disulfide isomerase